MSIFLVLLGSAIFIAWGCALMLFPKQIARFARKVQGGFWGRQFTPELTRFAGFGFVLGGVTLAVTMIVELLRR